MLLIDFINVGYGDSILLQFFSEEKRVYCALVDCGDKEIRKNSEGSRRISAAEYLEKLNIDTLDLLINTHLHSDHTGGLSVLTDQIKIKELWVNYLPPREMLSADPIPVTVTNNGARGLVNSLNTLIRSVNKLEQDGCRIRRISEKSSVVLPAGECTVNIDVPDPEVSAKQKRILDAVCAGSQDEESLHELDLFINNTSLRLLVSYEGKKIYLPGDTYGEYWERCGYEPCDVLKIPHHGHWDGVTEKLLCDMRPDFAVISVPDDRQDDCPSAKLLELLDRLECQTLFTGAVKTDKTDPHYHESVRLRISQSGISYSYITL